MMSRKQQPSRDILTQVERVRQRLERWRRTRKKRRRIPEELWQESVEVARSNGVNQTARALGLDYYGLKRRLDAGFAGSAVEQEPVASFVELVGASPVVVPECLVEVESASGTKMRIHLKGSPDIALLRSLFWGGALFFTGHRHAGENLAEVLKRRATQLGPPIQMCDALSRNLPKDFEVLLAHCIAHARRKFVEVAPNFPEECRYVLKILSQVYRNDAHAREEGMSAEERLRFHQDKSASLMATFKLWLTEQIAEHKVEPNSGLGEAIAYFTKHFDKLTLFLHVAGAPIDNNVCERALKKAILHRKAALFYKTENGARVGDLYMSLIHTCQLAKADPFDYLTELQKHHQELTQQPQDWMPWNYRQTLDRAALPTDPLE